MPDVSAANRLSQAAQVAEDYGDRNVTCDRRDLIEVTMEAFDARRYKAQRDALADALREVEAHHVRINVEAGRPPGRSHTLRLVRDALAKIEGSVE